MIEPTAEPGLAGPSADTEKPLTELQARVLAAYRTIEAKSTRPTVDLIRIELGGGSYTDIGPALKRVRAYLKQQRSPVTMPPEAGKELGALGDRLYTALYEAALKQADSRHADAIEEHRVVESELQRAHIEMGSMASDLAQLREQLRLANERADRHLEDNKALQAEFRAQTERAENDLRQSQQDTRAAREEAAVMRGQRDELKSQLHTQTLVSSDLQSRLDGEVSNRQRVERELGEEVMAHKGTAANNDKKDVQISELQSQAKLDRQAVSNANQQRESAVADAERHRTQVEALTRQNGEVNSVLAQAQKTIADMQRTADALPERLDRLIAAVTVVKPAATTVTASVTSPDSGKPIK